MTYQWSYTLFKQSQWSLSRPLKMAFFVTRQVKRGIFELLGALKSSKWIFLPLCVHLLSINRFKDDILVVICSLNSHNGHYRPLKMAFFVTRQVKNCVFELLGALQVNQMYFLPLCVHLSTINSLQGDILVTIYCPNFTT